MSLRVIRGQDFSYFNFGLFFISPQRPLSFRGLLFLGIVGRLPETGAATGIGKVLLGNEVIGIIMGI